MQALLKPVITYLKRQGVDYGDVRWQQTTHESLVVENGAVEGLSTTTHEGYGIRVLVGGSWGFAATPVPTAAALRRAAHEAVAIAQAMARVNTQPVRLTPVKPATATYRSHWVIDPFEVPLAKKLDYLLWACHVLQGHRLIRRAIASLDFYRIRKRFLSTEGADITQELIESAGQIEAVATSGEEVQRRSYPNSHHGAHAQAGYEYVKALDLVGGAETIRREAVALLSAKEPRPGETTVILDSSQVALQIHESCGHPVELDRVLGTEISFAGSSFLTPERRGKFLYGSSLINIVADAATPSGVGSAAFDDEGVPAQQTEIIKRGVFVGYLSSRETAATLGLRGSSGAMRAESWNVPPLIRMTNVNLLPGTATLEQLIRNTQRGYLLSTNKSWSIDDRRLNFQFSTEIGWEITRGKLGAMVKNPIYTGITPVFWKSCTGVGDQATWRLWGIPNCGKGEPGQSMHVGHGAPPARFTKVFVGRKRSA